MSQKPRQIPRQDLLIAALASGVSVFEAAKRSATSPRTVHRRLLDARFRAEVRQARARMVDTALGQLTDTLTDAGAALRQLLQSTNDSVRLNAARAIFDIAGKLRDQTDFEERLSKLEESHGHSTPETESP